jgi:hypothetical protein
LKPFDGDGWKNVSKINSIEELWLEYDQTGTLCMTLQQGIDFDQFVRCYCVGQEEVMIMAYDPRKPYLSGEQYVHNPDYLSPELHARVTKDVRTLCTALGYDLNTVEFAIKDGIPYAIDFMNPAPDAELASVGEFYHNWITNAVTDLVFKRLGEKRETGRYRWDAFLNPAPVHTSAVASLVEQQSRTFTPASTAESMPTEGKHAVAATAAESSAPAQVQGSGSKEESRGTREAKSETGAKPAARKNGKTSSPKLKTS